MGVFLFVFFFYTLTLKESLSLQECETEERSSLTRQMSWPFLFLSYLPGEPNQETDISTHCFESFFFFFVKYPDVFI